MHFFLASEVAWSRDALLREVWGWSFGDQSTVTVHVRRLREKVEADPHAAHPPRDRVGCRLPLGADAVSRDQVEVILIATGLSLAVGAVCALLSWRLRRASILWASGLVAVAVGGILAG